MASLGRPSLCRPSWWRHGRYLCSGRFADGTISVLARASPTAPSEVPIARRWSSPNAIPVRSTPSSSISPANRCTTVSASNSRRAPSRHGPTGGSPVPAHVHAERSEAGHRPRSPARQIRRKATQLLQDSERVELYPPSTTFPIFEPVDPSPTISTGRPVVPSRERPRCFPWPLTLAPNHPLRELPRAHLQIVERLHDGSNVEPPRRVRNSLRSADGLRGLLHESPGVDGDRCCRRSLRRTRGPARHVADSYSATPTPSASTSQASGVTPPLRPCTYGRPIRCGIPSRKMRIL